MKTISGKLISSTPVSISKAAAILSKFAASENGSSQAVTAYLRRATAAFDELARPHSKKQKLDVSVKEEMENGVKDEGKIGKMRIKEEKRESESNSIESHKDKKKKKKRENGNLVNIGENGGKVVIEEEKKKKKRKSREDEEESKSEAEGKKKKKRKVHYGPTQSCSLQQLFEVVDYVTYRSG
ncbi:uncharacterized protein LOC130014584 isoform X2 [Mercurialis annua]|uniref:uncharacterized protein LOC130014584 isoform X2 n=1 Tax=Mercurialis annua TaxID=3986 RepID=UPI0024ACEBFF|nr:uncharacterized protein LOC130014584 isoform X2 [Mercurialis annua]